MPTYTKHPEGIPVDVAIDKIVAMHPLEVNGDMCVKVMLVGGFELHISECLRDARAMIPRGLI